MLVISGRLTGAKEGNQSCVNAHFILPDVPLESLDEYIAIGGGAGLAAARAVAPEVIIAEIEASGLRGRGGAGFPTGTKWRTVVSTALTYS